MRGGDGEGELGFGDVAFESPAGRPAASEEAGLDVDGGFPTGHGRVCMLASHTASHTASH